jgi:hypothetical protein
MPWLKRILTAALIAVVVSLGVLIQVILVVLLCFLLPDQIAVKTILVSPFAIGVESYFIFRWTIKRREIRIEAERWLAQRSRRTLQQRARLYRSKQIGVCIPTAFVGVVFLFLPELFGVATHVLHPGPAKLIGYEVSFPMTWVVAGEGANDARTLAFAGAIDCRGPLRSGRRRYWFLNPPASAVDVVTSSSGSDIYHHNRNTPLSLRSVLLGGEPAICKEYPRYYDWEATRDLRIVECSTAKEEIFVSFAGDKSNLEAFYRNLESIRKIR